MTIPTEFLSTLVLLSCVAAATADPMSRVELEELRKEALMMDRSWMVYQRGHLLVKGTVVDEEGIPVSNFSVEYPHTRNEKDLANRRQGVYSADEGIAITPEKVNGKDGGFRIDAKYIEFFSVILKFQAKGYYDTELDMGSCVSDEEGSALDQAIFNSVEGKDWKLPNEVPIKKSLRVVMRKRGTPTKLERFYIDLAIMRKGERLGYQFASATEKGKSGPANLLPQDKNLPPRVIASSLKRAGNGEILAEKSDPSLRDEMPVDLKLVMNSRLGDGFLRYKPQQPATGDEGVRYWQEPIRRGMRTAPESGYQLELPISTWDLRGLDDVMFYFKCGGRYGRARYECCHMEKDHSKFTLRLEVELQPDGSRNLNTDE